MIEFKEVETLDKQWVQPLLDMASFRGCEYSFGTVYNWRKIFNTRIARVNDFFLSCSQVDGKTGYLFPAGSGDVAPVVEAMMADAKERGQRFSMFSVPEEAKAKLEILFPGTFHFKETRDSFDYIYDAEKLATLSGKKLASKRNHINYFMQNNDWSYEDITEENIDECYKMNQKWCEQNTCSLDESLRQEICAVKSAFRHFFELGLKGGLLRSGGEVVAYTMGERLTNDTLLVHIEKAFSEVRGAYPMINKQFILHNGSDYRYVNREDDVGDEGLRKAKLSYKPAFLLTKYRVTLAED
ncbi:DUF2156 domain-containing protein [Candidatus Soleaferrea massiliensis]|uniref:DUF2156 domain-containing protein n=1 Tax=Candidatus Soleaferrea massiliensis TaxID=1470354 RepID=UPI00058AFE4E|nr:phosphatidylglycerol lysyltransferase domain-containing protein [Candidatus Soleaferrea massiliensis]